jgi:hypothetical protein
VKAKRSVANGRTVIGRMVATRESSSLTRTQAHAHGVVIRADAGSFGG